MKLIPINKVLIEKVAGMTIAEFNKEFTCENLQQLLDLRLIIIDNNTIKLSFLGEQFKQNFKDGTES